MTCSRWNPDNLAPPIGQYSHLTDIPHDHDLVFICPDGDWPAQSRGVVIALATPELAIEIEGMAAVPRK